MFEILSCEAFTFLTVRIRLVNVRETKFAEIMVCLLVVFPNQRPVVRSRDLSSPSMGQYSPHQKTKRLDFLRELLIIKTKQQSSLVH